MTRGARTGAPPPTPPPAPRPHKFHARRTCYRDQWYDSAGEAAYARHLDVLKASGHIHEWRRGRPWVLLDPPPGGRRRDGIRYVPDFEVWPSPGQLELREFKGALTREFRLKAKLFRARYPDVPLVLVRANGSETHL